MANEDRYLKLDDIYNFQLALDAGAGRLVVVLCLKSLWSRLSFDSSLYLSWINRGQFFSSGLRDQWWRYHLMEWSEVMSHGKNVALSWDQKFPSPLPAIIH